MIKIYVEEKSKEGESLLSYFLRLYNINLKDKKYFPYSFHNKICDIENTNSIQCKTDKYRSLDELFIIANTMWGEVSEREFVKMIKDFIDVTRCHVIIFCDHVNKFVLSNRTSQFEDNWMYVKKRHHKHPNHIVPGYFYDYGSHIKSGLYKEKYKGNFTFENILSYMGYPDFYPEMMIKRSKELSERKRRKEEAKWKKIEKDLKVKTEERQKKMELMFKKSEGFVAV